MTLIDGANKSILFKIFYGSKILGVRAVARVTHRGGGDRAAPLDAELVTPITEVLERGDDVFDCAVRHVACAKDGVAEAHRLPVLLKDSMLVAASRGDQEADGVRAHVDDADAR